MNGACEKERKMGSELLADRTLGARKAEKENGEKPRRSKSECQARTAVLTLHPGPPFRASVLQAHRQP